jgi:hypothetical protein
MTQYAFGSGTLIGKRTDVANTPPALLGTLESVSLDFDRKVEFLLGQYNMPVAAGGGEFKIAGKAKFARLQATQINNLFLGQTLTANSMLEMTTGESDTVASGAVTVANVFFQSNQTIFNPTTGCYVLLSGGNVFDGTSNGALIQVDTHAQLHTAGDIGIASGAGNAAVQVISNGLFTSDSAGNINFLPGVNPSFSGLAFAYTDTQGQARFSGLGINLNGNSVTGTKCQANSGGLISSQGGVANTYFPGNSNCTQSGNGAVDGVISVAPGNVAGLLANANIANPTITVAGAACTLGSTCGLPTASNKLSSDVSLNNTSNYFDGPSMAQGSA